ncbi:MAG: PKD domain-containing protein, partial [Candidatus Heimdallarchaeota archaeon]
SSDIIIEENKICKNGNSGILISTGSGNTIDNNTIFKNNNIGIDISSPQSTIINNNIYKNYIGITLDKTSCTIRNNSISNSGTYGIYAGSGSSGNTIYINTFHNLQNGLNHAKEGGNNNWDNGTIGNYWSDYLGPNNDNDSIGDIPYTKGGVHDNYPTGLFQQPPEIDLYTGGVPCSPDPQHLEENVERQPSLSVYVTDPDGGRLDVYFYYILDNVSYLIDIDTKVESGKKAAIPFFSPSANDVYTYIGHGYDYICVWYVIVKDEYSETKSDEWIFSTLEVPINNTKPVVDHGGPYTGQMGDEIQFDGSGCNDTDGTIVFYRWSFGDGANIINVASPTHVYKDSGTYNISLVVIDNEGAVSTATTTLTIDPPKNDPPVANANGFYSTTFGKEIAFSGAGSDDPDPGDVITYFWDFGDGTNSTEKYPLYNYSMVYNYTVTLTVTDSSGLTDTDTTYALVSSPKKDESPGFEIIIAISAIIFILLWRRRKS